MLNIPKLNENARQEMPAATEKVSNYKGTFLVWFITIVVSALLAQTYRLENRPTQAECDRIIDANNDLKAENKDLKAANLDCWKKNEQQVNQIYALLQTGTMKQNKIEQQLDTIEAQTEKNENVINSSIKKLKNAAK